MKLTILRGSTTNDNLDEVADNSDDAIVATGIIGSVIEQNQRVFLPSAGPSQDTRVIRYMTGRIRSGIDLRNDDRVKDERTGTIYVVEGVRQPASPTRTNEIVFTMKYLATNN